MNTMFWRLEVPQSPCRSEGHIGLREYGIGYGVLVDTYSGKEILSVVVHYFGFHWNSGRSRHVDDRI